MRVSACPEPSQNRGNELMHRMGEGVWRAGFRCVLATTPPEPKEKHRFGKENTRKPKEKHRLGKENIRKREEKHRFG